MEQYKKIKEITNYYPAQPGDKLHLGGHPRSERTLTRLDRQQDQIFRALNLERFLAGWYMQLPIHITSLETRRLWI